MLEEIEIKARNVELRGENFTEEDYKKIATLMSELGKFPDTSAAATLKRKLESLVTVDADGKVIKVNNVKELKLTTKYARDPKFGTAIDFDKEISDAGDHLLTQRKTELETILTTSAFFKLYKDEADVIKAKLLKPDITMEEIEDIRKEMNELIKTAVDRDIEDLLSQAEVDMTDIPALESAKRDAELKKIKLGTVAKTSEQRKEYKADIEKKKRTITIFGREIDLGEGRDLSDLEDEDKVDERLDTVDEIYDKLMEGDETEREAMMTALSTHVKKPNIFRRAWFKITHWNQPSLYEQMQEDWLLDQIDQGITDIHREVIVTEASEPAWILTQEQEENIRNAEREIADEAKKKARKDVVTRGADPKTAARDAATAAKDNIDQEDLDLNI